MILPVTGPLDTYNVYPIRPVLGVDPAAARLLGLRVRILLGAWMFVCCFCRVGNNLCKGLITLSFESYLICASNCM
jgi:hypothetical protein